MISKFLSFIALLLLSVLVEAKINALIVNPKIPNESDSISLIVDIGFGDGPYFSVKDSLNINISGKIINIRTFYGNYGVGTPTAYYRQDTFKLPKLKKGYYKLIFSLNYIAICDIKKKVRNMTDSISFFVYSFNSFSFNQQIESLFFPTILLQKN